MARAYVLLALFHLCCCEVQHALRTKAGTPQSSHMLDYRTIVHKLGYLSTMIGYQRSFVDYNETAERNDDRRHSFPFVTGDGFRSLADIVVEAPENVAAACSLLISDSLFAQRLRPDQAAVVFVANDGMTFRALIDAKCVENSARPVVFVSHNGDADGIAKTHPILDHANVRVVFAQNCDGHHPKLTCIPIGLENRRWPRNGMIPEVLAGAMIGNLHGSSPADVVSSPTSAHIAASCFTPGTYPTEREPLAARNNGSAMGWIDKHCRHETFEFYRKLLRSAAVIAPRGNGKDTHRAWESLYLGRVIVTLSSSMDPLWEGLPVLMLKDWSQLSKDVIQKSVKAMSRPLRLQEYRTNTRKLFLDYWACLIGAAADRRNEFCTMHGIKQVLSA